MITKKYVSSVNDQGSKGLFNYLIKKIKQLEAAFSNIPTPSTPTLDEVVTSGDTVLDKTITINSADDTKGITLFRNNFNYTRIVKDRIFSLIAGVTYQYVFPQTSGELVTDVPNNDTAYVRKYRQWVEAPAGSANKEYYALVTVNSSGVPSLQQLRNTTGITFTVERNAAGSNRFTASSPVLTGANAGFTLQDSNTNPIANNPYVRGEIVTSTFLDTQIIANATAFGGVDTEHKYYIKIELMS